MKFIYTTYTYMYLSVALLNSLEYHFVSSHYVHYYQFHSTTIRNIPIDNKCTLKNMHTPIQMRLIPIQEIKNMVQVMLLVT